MVSIGEAIKKEFSDSYVHWDSDSGSDVSDSASVNTEGSQKKVNTLSTISLKTLFSKKCMGKVPKRLKLKSEAFDSFNDFGMGKKIDSIIDNLSNDDTHTSCDSDSILENNLAKDDAKTKDGTEKGDNDSIKNGKTSPTVLKDDSQTSCDYDSISEKNIKIASKKDEDDKVSDDTVNNVPEKQKDASEKHGTPEICDVVSETLNDTPEQPESNNISDDSENVSQNSIESEKDEESIKEKEEPKSLEENDKPKDEEMLEKDVSDDVELRCNTEISINYSNCKIDDKVSQNNENHSEAANENILINQLEVSQETENVTKEKDSKNDNVDSNSQFSRNIECLNEVKLINSHSDKNDTEKMEVDVQHDQHELTENNISKDATYENDVEDSKKTTENNENFSKIDEITSKILQENQTSHILDDKRSTYTNDDDRQKSYPYSDPISLNSIGHEIATQNQDKFNVNDLNEDDQQLMADLDAQIGENEQKISENKQDLADNIQKSHVNENDQRTKDFLIDNLLKKQNIDMRSLDLDNISDEEFNFDI